MIDPKIHLMIMIEFCDSYISEAEDPDKAEALLHCGCYSLCFSFADHIHERRLSVPFFNDYPEVKELFQESGGRVLPSSFWWPSDELKPRVEFLKKLRSKLEEKK